MRGACLKPSRDLFSYLLGISIVLVLGVFQNCAPSFTVATSGSGDSATLRATSAQTLLATLAQAKSFVSFDTSVSSGTLATDCSSSSYDACIFWKNPSASKYLSAGSYLAETADEDTYADSVLEGYQNFGVEITDKMTSGRLKSSTWDVFYRPTAKGTKNYFSGINGSFNFMLSAGHASSLGGQRYGLEQIQTFFFLDRFESFMSNHAGAFYAAGQGIEVNTVDATQEENAYFDYSVNNGAIEIGVRTGQSGRLYPLSLSSEVVVHESEHSNLHHANTSLAEVDQDYLVYVPCSNSNPYYVLTSDEAERATNISTTLKNTCGQDDSSEATYTGYCSSASGCLGAIDEGQADFFAMAFFASAPSMGELSLGKDYVRYWRKRANVNRSNLQSALGFTEYDDYAKKQLSIIGEIHDMGEIFSEMMFEIYVQDGVNRDAFLKTASEHLSGLSQYSTFTSVKEQLVSIDKRSYGGVNSSYIRSVFEGRGF